MKKIYNSPNVEYLEGIQLKAGICSSLDNLPTDAEEKFCASRKLYV